MKKKITPEQEIDNRNIANLSSYGFKVKVKYINKNGEVDYAGAKSKDSAIYLMKKCQALSFKFIEFTWNY